MSLRVPWLFLWFLPARAGRAGVLANLPFYIFCKSKVCIAVCVSLREIADVLGILVNSIPKDFGVVGTVTGVPVEFPVRSIVDLQIRDIWAFGLVIVPCVHEIIKMSDLVEETTSPVVPILQLGLLICRRLVAGRYCVFESLQFEEVVAKSDSTVFRVIRIWITKCFQSIFASTD
jgi:hypothetical protein